ncbi:MAG TPA: nucleoside kinase [Eubacteriaceae bacterium]|nr:nucleoside kinase [Eubacteriaceae bacterium]
MKNKEKIIITFSDGTKGEYPKGISLLELSRERQNLYKTQIFAAKVDMDLKELFHTLEKDAQVDFIDLTSVDGIRIYQRSLIFVLIKATRDLFPNRQLSVEHSLGKGIYCEIHGEKALTKYDVKRIKHRMEEIIQSDLPFIKKKVSIKEAMEIFNDNKEYGKINLLRYRKEDQINMYSLEDYQNYFYGFMAPSTGLLKEFDLKFYLPGVVLLSPTIESPEKTPTFVEQEKLFSIFRKYSHWAEIIEVNDVAVLNESVETEKISELIRVAEANHEKGISKIADEIYENIENKRIILIAGPSSSGKTTFANRLSTHLRINGLKPIAISLDDYFIEREFTPLDEYGEYDFESIDAIDVDLFNDQLISLIQGEEVHLPRYNFITGKREYVGRIIKLKKNEPIIIEGIHGLNDKLTKEIPQENKYKIYISALTQLNVDQHNRIPTTDTRLIRRMVRDNRYRNNNALKTLKTWAAVRRGEEKNIFPFQEDADIMFNSALFYELGVLKKYAEPLLREIAEDSPYYSEAKRLLKLLKYFVDINDESSILQNSILREFIGGNIYHP